MAREYGVFVVEDEAHAMLTDLVGGICGRLGDACIFSFHKILPVARGGAAVINDPRSPLVRKLVAEPEYTVPLCEFDLNRIADRRRANSMVLDELLTRLVPEVQPLFGAPDSREVPQSYPVLVHGGLRDRLYHELNDIGFGVISLYHALISQVSPHCFPAIAEVSQQILNLPVHQDASEDKLELMISELAKLMRKE